MEPLETYSVANDGMLCMMVLWEGDLFVSGKSCGIIRRSDQFSFCGTQFDLMNTAKTGVVTANELHAGMKVVKTNQTVTMKEVEDIITRHDAKKQGGLDFEDFLRVFLTPCSFTSALF